jgi:RHS repeat-associated protein
LTATDNSWFNYPAATPSTVSYTPNALNQYSAVGTVSPTYDGNGNLTFDGTFTYGYDGRSRLTSAVGAGNTAAYTFDAQGRRKTKTVNGTTTIFVTDADNREVLEYDGTSGAILRWYAYGLGSNNVLNQTNVVAATRSALIPDIQGSIIATLDSGTGSLTKAGYLAYGQSTNAPSTFGYTAQRIDPETNGLYYYRTRHYSPLLGRFLQTDPSGTKGGINLYAYAKNDPLNFVDIYGRAPDAPNSYAAQVSSVAASVNEIDTSDEEEESGANFYVNSAGTAIPSTGYRAITGQYAVDEALGGTIAPRPGGTYVTFNDITQMSPAAVQSLLQLPNAPSYVATFDTLPYLDSLQIPREYQNTGLFPEPLTTSYPGLGQGGGTQAIINLTLNPIIVRPLPTGGVQ